MEYDFIKQLELQEATYWSDYFHNATERLKKTPGLHTGMIDGTYCCSAPAEDVLVFNRVLCAGLTNVITSKYLQSLKAHYKSVGSKRFMVQVAPTASPEDFSEILKNEGFTHLNNWAKSLREIGKPVALSESKVTVEHLAPNQIEDFNNVVLEAFDWGNGLNEMFTLTYGKKGWFHYLAKENEKPVGIATMFTKNKFASLAIAGTIPDARGKGVQTALIRARLNDAIKVGCRYAVVETAEDKPDNPVTSYKNMMRQGFQRAYLRPGFLYEF